MTNPDFVPTPAPSTGFKILGYEPTLVIGALASGITLIGTLGFSWMDATQAALLVILVNAILGAINALLVRPVAPVVFTYLVASAAQFAAAYGYDVSTATLGAINGFVLGLLTLVLRGQVTPEESPVTDGPGGTGTVTE